MYVKSVDPGGRPSPSGARATWSPLQFTALLEHNRTSVCMFSMLNSCSSLQQCWIYCHCVTLSPLQAVKLSEAECGLFSIYWRWSLKKGIVLHECLTVYLNGLQYVSVPLRLFLYYCDYQQRYLTRCSSSAAQAQLGVKPREDSPAPGCTAARLLPSSPRAPAPSPTARQLQPQLHTALIPPLTTANTTRPTHRYCSAYTHARHKWRNMVIDVVGVGLLLSLKCERVWTDDRWTGT